LGIIRRYFDTLNELRSELAAERAARFYATQRLAELKLQHATALEEARRRLAIAQANFEWLSIAFNKAEAERSQLLLGRLGIVAPPMSVQLGSDLLPQGATIEERRRAQELNPDRPGRDEIDALLASGSLFEDIGERAARSLGLADGETYDPNSALLKG
jgi:hypothetical protein